MLSSYCLSPIISHSFRPVHYRVVSCRQPPRSRGLHQQFRAVPSKTVQKAPAPNTSSATYVTYLIKSLSEQIAAAEARLQSCFKPGSRMPKASVVANMRREIADLKASLAVHLTSDDEQQLQQGTSSIPAQLPAAARSAFLEVQGLIDSKKAAERQRLADELAAAQAEHEYLSARVKSLSERRQMLMDLVALHLNKIEKAR